jgi:Trp operon repressor
MIQELKGSYASEASMNLFINAPESVSKLFLLLVREQFSKIAGAGEVERLLELLLSSDVSMRSSVLPLLRDMNDGQFTELFVTAYSKAKNQDRKKELFDLITRQNNLEALNSALDIISSYGEIEGERTQNYIYYLINFSAPALEEVIRDGVNALIRLKEKCWRQRLVSSKVVVIRKRTRT